MARKPRDYDAELQALMDKAKKVRTQKTTQLGELVQIVGADALPMEALPGHSSPWSSRARNSPAPSRGGPRRASRSFSQGAGGGRQKQPATLLQQLQASTAQLHRLTVLRNRLVLAQNRTYTRDWAQERRARTRQLIERGPRAQGRAGRAAR